MLTDGSDVGPEGYAGVGMASEKGDDNNDNNNNNNNNKNDKRKKVN